MIVSQCQVCGVEITRAGFVPAINCSRACAAVARRESKGVSRDWLFQKYVIEKLGTTRIARLVKRDPKRIYEWLVGYGIPLREKWRGNIPAPQPFHSPEWLREEYVAKGKRIKDIASECGVVDGTIFRYLVKFGIPTRTGHESRVLAGTVPDHRGPKNAMFGRTGPLSSNWKGGCTPERQAFYNSNEWKEVSQLVWHRDGAACQRCGKKKRHRSEEYEIHHVVSFAVKHLRAEPSNLILLCEPCHTWAHSNANVDRAFIKEYVPDEPRVA